MTGGFDAISNQLKAIESEVLEFKVGVSHIALDEERERNMRIRERIESILASLEKNHKVSARKSDSDKAQRILTTAANNTDTLRYLESISCLEGIFADVTRAATITAVKLSDPKNVNNKILSTRFLSKNVKQCWEYTSELNNLTGVHLKLAAEFQTFYHDINEVRAHAKRLKKLSESSLTNFSPKGDIEEASNLAKDINERFHVFSALAERAKYLTAKATSIFPIENRLLDVENGRARGTDCTEPLMVQLLANYVGHNCNLKKGESFTLLDTTENPGLWRVQTQQGPLYIPSIICVVASATSEQICDAHETLLAVRDACASAIESWEKQLAIYYTKALKMLSQCKGVHITDFQAQKEFVQDLEFLLLKSDTDDSRLARAMDMFSDNLTTKPKNAVMVLKSSEMSVLHQPLRILRDQVLALKQLDEIAESSASRMNDQIWRITSDGRNLSTQLENLRTSQEQNEAELKQLYDRVRNWRSVVSESIDAPKTGVGRLVLSSLSTSSGVSSEEFDAIPRLPSPFSRLAVTDVTYSKETESGITDEVYIEPSKVFSSNTNLLPMQIQTGVNVKPTRGLKPPLVRDVGIQVRFLRLIQNTQTDHQKSIAEFKFGTTQSEPHRKDCMTQIGVIKAPKGQQVDVAVINAAMQIEGHRLSFATTSEEAFPHRTQKSYTTGVLKDTTGVMEVSTPHVKRKDLITQVGRLQPQAQFQTARPKPLETGHLTGRSRSTDSGTFAANVPLEDGEIGTDRKQHNVILQVQPSTETSQFETPLSERKSYSTEAQLRMSLGHTEHGGKPVADYGSQVMVRHKSGEVHAHSGRPVTASFKCTRSVNELNFKANNNTSSQQFETIQPPPACLDTEALVSRIPKVTSIHDVKRTWYEGSQSTSPRYAQCETPRVVGRFASGCTKSAAGCQVGTLLVPREVKVSAVSVEVGNKLMAGKLNVPMNSILCPATIECHPVLTEDTGIQIVNLKEVNQLNIQTGEAVFLAGVHKSKSPNQPSKAVVASANASPNEVCVIEFASPESTMSQGKIALSRDQRSRGTTPARVLTGAECQFSITGMQLGSFHQSKSDSSTTYSTSPSVKLKHSTTSTQVGTTLTPTTVQIVGVNMKSKDPSLGPIARVGVNNVICPSNVELKLGLTETSGIQIKDIGEVDNLNVLVDGSAYYAKVRNHLNISKTRQDLQNRGVSFTKTQDGLEIDQTSGGHLTLREAGCQFDIVSPKVEGFCNFCRKVERNNTDNYLKTPKTSTSCTKGPSFVQQHSSTPVSKTVECQVGTRIRPSAIQVEKLVVKPKDPKIAEYFGIDSNSYLCPVRVQMQPELTELAGIEMIGMADVNSVEIHRERTSILGHIQPQRCNRVEVSMVPKKTPVMHLNIQGDQQGLAIGEATSKITRSQVATGPDYFSLGDIGCEIALHNSTIGDLCTSCMGSGKAISNTASKSLQNTSLITSFFAPKKQSGCTTRDVKHAFSQVGTMLIPKMVQVADMPLALTEERVAMSLGLKANAIICPSTVELETKLTETSGLSVMDVRDVEEIGITVGNKEVVACVSGRPHKNDRLTTISQHPEPVHLTFVSRQSPNQVGSLQKFNKPTGSKGITSSVKMIDLNGGCTFQIRQPGKLLMSDSCSIKPTAPPTSVRQENVSCQVGVVMVPCKMHIYPGQVNVADRICAGALGVSIGSNLKQTTCELEPHIAETSGVNIAKITAVDQLTVHIGTDVFEASIVGGNQKAEVDYSNLSCSKQYSLANKVYLQKDVDQFNSTLQYKSANISNLLQPYLVGQIDCHSQKDSLLELCGLTLDGKKVQLRVKGDIRGNLHMQTAPMSSESRSSYSGYLNLSSNLNLSDSYANSSMLKRPDSRLCDVACEAIIRPETMEKRLQTINL